MSTQANAPRPGRVSIFISYSHNDSEWLVRVRTHLAPLERDRGLTLEVWDDARLRAGDLWQKEIRAAIASARAAVLLVSANFFASDFITGSELPPLLEAAEKTGTVILPLIIGPSRFPAHRASPSFRRPTILNGRSPFSPGVIRRWCSMS